MYGEGQRQLKARRLIDHEVVEMICFSIVQAPPIR